MARSTRRASFACRCTSCAKALCSIGKPEAIVAVFGVGYLLKMCDRTVEVSTGYLERLEADNARLLRRLNEAGL